MIKEVENPHLSIEDLSEMEYAIRQNLADIEVYKALDDYLSFIGVGNYILSALKDNSISGYAQFIDERKKQPRTEINILVGSVLGVVSVLKKYISGKL